MPHRISMDSCFWMHLYEPTFADVAANSSQQHCDVRAISNISHNHEPLNSGCFDAVLLIQIYHNRHYYARFLRKLATSQCYPVD